MLLPVCAAVFAADKPVGGYAARYAQTCAACHGPAGQSVLPLTPSLAGQPAFYTITQLFLYREGRRSSPAMSAMAQSMTDEDLRGFADFIATLAPVSSPTTPRNATRIERGRALAQQHRCGTCHGTAFTGGDQVPRLAHQREDYLREVLRGIRSGTRSLYTLNMGDALAGIPPESLDEISYFLANLPSE